MKDEFVKYLKSVGITETFRKRIERIHRFCAEVCPDEITGIFVTDYVGEDGSREYENLWFFSSKCCMEAKLFITKDNFDVVPLQNRIVRWAIEKQDYDFNRATKKSRLYVKFTLESAIHGDLKASKENCDHLKAIVLKYIVPNLRE